jgi:hypothetical protein
MNSIKELIFTIRQRTPMYIGQNNIFCLKAFLDGWLYSTWETTEDRHLITDFQSWIEERFKITSSQSWARIIHFYSMDEQDAVKNFFEFFDEFLESKNF